MPTYTISAQEQILQNLSTAFHGESNASARYAAFAIKADEERYFKVGSLFRAVARAERIHAANHAQAFQQFGGAPAPRLKALVVKSTEENLQTALEGELYDTDYLYPAFIREAEAQAHAAARRSFIHAFEAEKEHAWLFTMVLEDIQYGTEQEWRKLMNRAIYYVCPSCGCVTDKTDFERCPACGNAKETFRVVS